MGGVGTEVGNIYGSKRILGAHVVRLEQIIVQPRIILARQRPGVIAGTRGVWADVVDGTREGGKSVV